MIYTFEDMHEPHTDKAQRCLMPAGIQFHHAGVAEIIKNTFTPIGNQKS